MSLTVGYMSLTAPSAGLTPIGSPTSGSSNAGTSLNINYPTGTSVGDVTFVFVASNDQTGPTVYTGWTRHVFQVFNVGFTRGSIEVFSRTYQSGDGVNLSWTKGANPMVGFAITYRGANATPEATHSAAHSNSPSYETNPFTVTETGVTTSGANRVLLVFGNAVSDGPGGSPTNPTWTPAPTGMTQEITDTITGWANGALFSETIAAAGATGSRTLTCTHNMNILTDGTCAIAVAPA